jgi:hypothetical protein
VTGERCNNFGLKIMKFVDIPDCLRIDHQNNELLIQDSEYKTENRFVIFSSKLKKLYIEKSQT